MYLCHHIVWNLKGSDACHQVHVASEVATSSYALFTQSFFPSPISSASTLGAENRIREFLSVKTSTL